MSNLGEKLKAREAREKADKLVKLERESRESGEQAVKDLELVREFFNRARDEIIADISDDRPVREITLGKRGDDTGHLAHQVLMTYNWSSNKGIASPHHKYFAVWEQFHNWTVAEGLDVKFVQHDDGYGIESWYVLHVKAFA
jgi:hypothetical protein